MRSPARLRSILRPKMPKRSSPIFDPGRARDGIRYSTKPASEKADRRRFATCFWLAQTDG
jgi:hypothetical protein